MRLIQEEFIIKMNELGYDLHGSDPIRETLFGTIYEIAEKLKSHSHRSRVIEKSKPKIKMPYKKDITKEVKDEN